MLLQNNNYLAILDSFIMCISSILERNKNKVDFCPDETSWSIRQHIYHLLDTPTGGIHSIMTTVKTNPKETLVIIPDLDNITEDNQKKTTLEIQADLINYSKSFHNCLSLYSEEDLDQIIIQTSLPKRGIIEDRTPRSLLDRLFVRHWSEHISDLLKL
ncbi:MAG TPA: hypothetical protein DEZ08_02330 [Dehalococcoidia bacterium]|jgi:hypothetical protein|nr:hypothetical protein [Dehalococcoidia bacterium]